MPFVLSIVGAVPTSPIADFNPGAASVTIAPKRLKLKFAPEHIEFDLDFSGFDTPAPENEGDYDARRDAIVVSFEFGDPGSTFAAPVNILTHQRDANTAVGWPSAHLYRTPGSYTVTVTAFEPSSGKMATGTLNMSGADAVADADIVFAGNTYTVDPDGGADYTSLFDAVVGLRGSGDRHRIVLAAGKTFDGGAPFRGDFHAAGQTMYIDGGTGAKPIITKLAADVSTLIDISRFPDGNTANFVFSNVIVKSNWDETTESNGTDPLGSHATGFTVSEEAPDYISLVDVDLDGTNFGVYGIVNGANLRPVKGIYMADCSFTSWRGFGILGGSAGTVSIIGCLLARSPNALAGGPKNGFHNDHGPVRIEIATRLIVASSDLFSNTGWFPNIFGYVTQQPCIRHQTTGGKNAATNITRNTFEGSFVQIEFRLANDDSLLFPTNAIVSSNIMIDGFMTQASVATGLGGISFRNNIRVRPDVPIINGIYAAAHLINGTASVAQGVNQPAASAAQIAENQDAPIKAYNNTYAILTTDARVAPEITGETDAWLNLSGFNFASEANNLLHAPNFSGGITPYAPLDATSVFSARMLGYRSGYELIDHTQGAGVADTASFTIAYPAGRGQSDYSASGAKGEFHRLKTAEGEFDSNTQISVSFDAGQITVTNNTGQTLAAGDFQFLALAFDSPPPRLTQYATPPATPALYAPQTGSAAIGDANTGQVAYTDFYGAVRTLPANRGAT